jgi:hypothetical protein
VHLVVGGLDEEDEREAAKGAPCRKMPAGAVGRGPPRSPDQRDSDKEFIHRHWDEPFASPKTEDLANRKEKRD